MSITFEEVTGEIQREPTAGAGAEPSAAREKPAEEDLPGQIERSLRLLDERRARLGAD
jgi:hypothetical protein